MSPSDPQDVRIPPDVLLPQAIEFNLQHNPEHPFFTYVAEGTSEIATITHLEFGRAAHRVAHILRPNREGQDGQVVAMLALVDTPLAIAVTAGLIAAGFVPLLISPRNSAAAVVNLLQKTSSHKLLTTQATLSLLLDQVRSSVANISPTFELVIEEFPSMADAYPKLSRETRTDPFQAYPAPVQPPLLDDVVAYMHSSGSTGLPKPIVQTNRMILQAARRGCEFRTHDPPLNFGAIGIPSFHAYGWTVQLLYPLYELVPVAIYPPTVTAEAPVPVTPSASDVLEHARRNKVLSMFVVPSLPQSWVQSPEAIEYLKTLECVIYGGGVLVPAVGNLLVDAGVRIFATYAATETGPITYYMPLKDDEKDWQYVRFLERADIRWVPQGDGTLECQILTSEKFRPMVENLPDVKGYATSDLFHQHPTKPHLWKPVGRIDDVIIHSSGEKTVPAPMEAVVCSSPLIQETVMFGRGHDQAGILIEPAPGHEINVTDDLQLAELRNNLWPIIEEANKIAPTFSRIFKEMILITSKEKPLIRTPKRTVMRQASLKLYDAEIEALYQEVERATTAGEAIPPPAWSRHAIEEWLFKQAVDISSGKSLSPSIYLFEQGFDSLSATFFRRRIVGAMRASKDTRAQKATESISQDIVYKHPTIQLLAAHLAELIAPSGNGSVVDPKAAIEEMIEKYSVGLDGQLLGATSTTRPLAASVVLLTGSTGNLGSPLLASLLQDPRVQRVYAFNRAPSGVQSMFERHIGKFTDWGLDVTLLKSDKVFFVSGDTALPNLGIDSTLYDEMRTSVDVIIHNAWKVDFNQSLSSFESQIQGTRHLIDLALSGPNPSDTRFVFTSSIGAVQGWDRSKGPVPEDVLEDASVAIGPGYGESKYISERILRKSGLHASSLRLGQISGGRPNGAWATTDWVPIFVKSGLALGALPNPYGVVSWLPSDAVVSGVIDVVFSPGRLPPVSNMIHPQPVTWNSVILAIKAALKDTLNRDLEVVSLHEWFARLERRAEQATEQDMMQIPAIKLLDFFRHLTEEDEELQKAGKSNAVMGGTGDKPMVNQTVGKLRQLEAADMMNWVGYWHEKGFLN